MRGIARVLLENALRRYGYVLRRADETPRGYAGFLAFANDLGIDPKTVVDIGVGRGTPWLYESYPDKKFVLFEALREFEPHIAEFAKRYDMDVIYTGLGSARETRRINVPAVGATGSSFLDRTDEYEDYRSRQGKDASNAYHEIQIETLDSVMDHPAPYVLKIDVEGFELEVLRGATNTLKQTLMVIAEVSINRRYVGESNFAAVAHFLDESGFDVFDFLSFDHFSFNRVLAYCDVAFINRDLVTIRG